jgi:hypothetical protein
VDRGSISQAVMYLIILPTQSKEAKPSPGCSSLRRVKIRSVNLVQAERKELMTERLHLICNPV